MNKTLRATAFSTRSKATRWILRTTYLVGLQRYTFDGLLQAAVGNGRFYGGGMVVAPGSRIDDKALDVFAIKNGRGWDLAGVARHLKTGEFVENPCVYYWRTSRVQVETDHELPINLDGELVSHTPKLFSVAPNTLKVLVPESSTSVRLDEASAARELVLNR